MYFTVKKFDFFILKNLNRPILLIFIFHFKLIPYIKDMSVKKYFLHDIFKIHKAY